MFQLKPIARESISRALAKAERYRLLNEPREAESICRDVLDVDPHNQEALICLILAETDTFGSPQARPDDARQLASRLRGEYERAYFAGVVEERWSKALHAASYPADTVYLFLRKAMEHFEAAEGLAPEGNDDAVLRWNACVRLIDRHALAPSDVGDACEVESLDDDVPMR